MVMNELDVAAKKAHCNKSESGKHKEAVGTF